MDLAREPNPVDRESPGSVSREPRFGGVFVCYLIFCPLKRKTPRLPDLGKRGAVLSR